MIELIGLAGFAIPGFLVLLVVGSAPRLECPECEGDIEMRFNGEYVCGDCGYCDEK